MIKSFQKFPRLFIRKKHSEKVKELYENPINVGKMDKSKQNVGTGTLSFNGNTARLQIEVDLNTNIIKDAKFLCFGNPASVASVSIVTEWVKGKKVDEICEIESKTISEYLSLRPIEEEGSILAENVIKEAVEDWKKKNVKN